MNGELLYEQSIDRQPSYLGYQARIGVDGLAAMAVAVFTGGLAVPESGHQEFDPTPNVDAALPAVEEKPAIAVQEAGPRHVGGVAITGLSVSEARSLLNAQNQQFATAA